MLVSATRRGTTPFPAPLDSCLRRNDALGAGAHDAVRVRVTDGRILRVGGGPFDRLRANGFCERVCGGVGCAGASTVAMVEMPRPSGYRLSPVRRWGVRERREGETAPCLAPALGSRFRENDDGGVGERRELMAAEGEVPASAGTTGGVVGAARVVGGVRAGLPHPDLPSSGEGNAPAVGGWPACRGSPAFAGAGSAFAGTTRGLGAGG